MAAQDVTNMAAYSELTCALVPTVKTCGIESFIFERVVTRLQEKPLLLDTIIQHIEKRLVGILT